MASITTPFQTRPTGATSGHLGSTTRTLPKAAQMLHRRVDHNGHPVPDRSRPGSTEVSGDVAKPRTMVEAIVSRRRERRCGCRRLGRLERVRPRHRSLESERQCRHRQRRGRRHVSESRDAAQSRTGCEWCACPDATVHDRRPDEVTGGRSPVPTAAAQRRLVQTTPEETSQSTPRKATTARARRAETIAAGGHAVQAERDVCSRDRQATPRRRRTGFVTTTGRTAGSPRRIHEGVTWTRRSPIGTLHQ